MKVEKRVVGHLEKCYSIAPLSYNGKMHFLVAAEKKDPCMLLDTEGRLEETVWEQPGGTMSMVQIPGTNGQFLATHKFYSPNDSKDAKIVVVTPGENGKWEVNTLVELPFVHRFDILERNGVHYLIACTLKSGHDYKDDWEKPGKVYAAVLPRELSGYHEGNQLELKVIRENLTRNHGYYRIDDDGIQTALISAQEGVFQFIPPVNIQGEWEVHQLLEQPCSDSVLVDLDEDGEKELVVISPFHGDTIEIYKKLEGTFQKQYTYENIAEFSHAIFGGTICGKPMVVIGHRKGERNLIAFYYDKSQKEYISQILDRESGAANIYKYSTAKGEFILAANREINEIALYKVS